MLTAIEALERLKEGNKRFVEGDSQLEKLVNENRRDKLISSQAPFAVIIGCSDSRVPVEIVFDQGLGDLFVIRVAGNIVAPSQIGSVEFAAEQFGTRLVVVMGHSKCGAVHATLEQLQRPTDAPSKNLGSIVKRIRPAVEALVYTDLRNDQKALAEQAIRANVRMSVNTLSAGSAVLENLIKNDGLMVVGAEYSLETGQVHFFDN
ncbi:carbonic anhydrase [Bowmanella sp. Y26]|uniref:carbonic anhydrase n=1 Tax=Bowmanella yangjiangensis TaxID=2811230 RepID=UPI001BDCFC2E|nr:carbonic anhydrase [Bowmanella yangjiangensis]MBT1064628.1 carbonic anhydrase [Bowmanella yangjiangensis]